MATEGSEDGTRNDQEAEIDIWNRINDPNDAKDAGIDTSEERDADISKIEAEMRAPPSRLTAAECRYFSSTPTSILYDY
uniref:Phosducin domain-containing protein n=1 Tax=Panagrellus redivivus TaxID=6233 RepID=A0A7E4WBE3_PANRE